MSDPAVDADLAAVLRTCAVRRPWAEQEEGPYHRKDAPQRRDVVEDRVGAPLQLGLRMVDRAGEPVHGTAVEIWHCDALGRYSGSPPPEPSITVDEDATFLRGYQTTDEAGMVEFQTIYPGWYPGRTVHIHLRVRSEDLSLTSQLYFPEHVSSAVLSQPPYAERPGRDTTNDNDEIFPTGGEPAVLDLSSAASGHRAALSLILPGGMP